MEAIKCPVCGCEKVKEVTEEKYICLACDNVFLVHNRSKEFRETDSHIASVHQDLKDEISRVASGHQDLKDEINRIGRVQDKNYTDENANLEAAEGHMKNGNFAEAYDFFYEVARAYPRHAAGWYGMYRALTGNFQVERYGRFLCGGNYAVEDQPGEGEEVAWFDGNALIKNALLCEDADVSGIKHEVTQFLKKCAQYGKEDIENTLRNIIDDFKNGEFRYSFEDKMETKGEKRKNQLLSLLPALFIIASILLMIRYFMATDWLGKVIAVVIIVLILKFGHEKIGDTIGDVLVAGQSWETTLYNHISVAFREFETKADTLIAYLIDLGNYNYLLSELEQEDRFIQKYKDGSFDGLSTYNFNVDQETKKGILFNVFTGREEEYRYLLGDEPEAADEEDSLLVLLKGGVLGFLYEKLKNKNGYDANPGGNGGELTNGLKNITDKLGFGGEEPGSSGSRFCPACGSPVDKDAVFCTKCGSKLG